MTSWQVLKTWNRFSYSCANLNFSFSCGENWHDPVKCKWLRRWIKKCDDDSETSNWIAANTKVLIFIAICTCFAKWNFYKKRCVLKTTVITGMSKVPSDNRKRWGLQSYGVQKMSLWLLLGLLGTMGAARFILVRI